MQAKHLLRKELLAKRAQVSNIQQQQWDEDVLKRLQTLVMERKAQSVHTFIAMPGEVNTWSFIQWLLDERITVVCPKTLANRALEHRVLNSLQELETGKFGTQHPASSLVYTQQPDIIIVPGLAFDEQGFRMGYGAGYYDTFLAQYPKAYQVGVCYPFQYMQHIPTEPHDAKLNQVIVAG